jgi:hypothetical protein
MKILKYILSGILTYYFTSIVGGKLYLLDGILNNVTSDKLLKNNWLIVWVLVGLNIMTLILEDIYNSYKKEKTSFTPIYSEICKNIYNKHFAKFDAGTRNEIRVSIHKGIRTWYKGIRLVNIGRYQKTIPSNLSWVKFRMGEGCAGRCFQENIIISLNLEYLEDYKYLKRIMNYKKEFKIRFLTALFLLRKSKILVSVPIVDGEEKPWGVLTIDTMRISIEKLLDIRDLEKDLSEYKCVFVKREIA